MRSQNFTVVAAWKSPIFLWNVAPPRCIKYVTCYHCGAALCISSLTQCGHARLSEDPVGGCISITVWLIGVIYSPLAAADSFEFLDAFYCPQQVWRLPAKQGFGGSGKTCCWTVFYSNRRIIAGLRGEGVGGDLVSKAAQNCCFVYSLGSVFHLLLLLHSSGPSHSVVAASRQTAERGTLDRKKILTPPICHSPCSTHLTGTRERMWGSGVKKKKKTSRGKWKRACLRNVCLTS